MEQELIDRINVLARKSRTVGLTDTERDEQRVLRARYLEEFRAGFAGVLEHTVIRRPDGTEEHLKKR